MKAFTRVWSPIMIAAGIVWGIYQFSFFTNSQSTAATVTNITSSETKCYGSIEGLTQPKNKRTATTSCTMFNATINYSVPSGETLTAQISAGEKKGRSIPIDQANFKIGQQIKIYYNSKNPSKVDSESNFELSIVLIILTIAIGAIGTLFGYYFNQES